MSKYVDVLFVGMIIGGALALVIESFLRIL